MGQMDGREIANTPRTITDKGLAESSARLVPPLSVILSTRAPIGHLAINTTPMAFNQGCRGIVPRDGLDHVFLYYFLLANRELLDSLGTGTTFKELSGGSLKAVPIPLPPLEEQHQIVAVLDEAFEGLARARAHAEANLRDARELFASYLGNFFRSNDKDWVTFSIGQLVAQEVLYKPQDGNHGEIHPKKSDFVQEGVPFIMASDLKGGRVDQVGCNHLTRVQADTLRTGFAIDGDVLLSHKGTIGRTAILETELEYVMLTPQVTYYRVRDTSRLLPEFLYFAFQSATFQHDLIAAAQDGATRAYIGITRQLDLHLSVPSIETQRELVSLFQDMQQKTPVLVEAYKRQLSDIDALRQSLLQKAFAGELT